VRKGRRRRGKDGEEEERGREKESERVKDANRIRNETTFINCN
jgi:hypothetical protein